VADQAVEQVDDVVVVDQRVGEPDEGPDQQLLLPVPASFTSASSLQVPIPAHGHVSSVNVSRRATTSRATSPRGRCRVKA
jgi:hypothetical protein